jgi:hypothetical protein
LLILFIPTLALALLRAVLDAAGKVREFSSAFLFFVISSIGASAIGVFGGVGLSYLRHDLDKEQLQTVARAFGGRPEDVAYDPHPLLTQFGKVVPTNPLGALSDPNGNSGLQIAFIAVVIGGVLAGYRQASRQAISASLKKTLSVFVKDNQSTDTAISDYADWAAPIGVFCLGAATLSKMDAGALQEMASLVLTSVACLAIFVVLLLIWIRFRRNWKDWFEYNLQPEIGHELENSRVAPACSSRQSRRSTNDRISCQREKSIPPQTSGSAYRATSRSQNESRLATSALEVFFKCGSGGCLLRDRHIATPEFAGAGAQALRKR